MQFEVTATINRPVANVFAFFRDIERYAGKSGSVVPVYDKLTPGPTDVGTRYHEVVRLSPWHTIENMSEIAAMRPNSHLALRFWFTNGRMHGDLSYDFAETENGTHVIQRQTLFLAGWPRLFQLLVRQMFMRQIRRRMIAIQFILENSRVAAPGNGVLSTTYYLERREQILKGFKPFVRHLRPLLVERYGMETAVAILHAAHRQLCALIVQMPYIGGRHNSLTPNLIGTSYSLAFYQAMQAHGVDLKTTASIHQALIEAHFAHTPWWKRRLSQIVTRLIFTKPGQRLTEWQLRRSAKASQKRQYPDDFVFDYVAGDDFTFDFGIDYTECGICKFYAAQGAAEFTRYVCLYDYPHSALTGSGLARTMTLAEGAPKCDFRFKRGRTPQNWQQTQTPMASRV